MYNSDLYVCNTAGQMAGHTGGYGDMWRRDCFMNPWKKPYNSNACNEYACYWYYDCSGSWDTYYPSGYSFGITVERVTTNNTSNWCISTPLMFKNGTRIGAF